MANHQSDAGRRIVQAFTPFVIDSLALGLVPKIVRRHRDNLRARGAEPIRRCHQDDVSQDGCHPVSSYNWLKTTAAF